MKPRTRLTPTEVAGVRAARAKGASIDELAKQFGRSRSHIANLVRHHAELTRAVETTDAKPPLGALESARAEFEAPRAPLVVETLEERLKRAIPGAEVVREASGSGVAVWIGRRCLAFGHSQRDVTEKAIALYGVPR